MSFRVLFKIATKIAKQVLLFGDFMASVSSSEKIKSEVSLTSSEIVGMINLFKKPCKYLTDGAHDVLSFKSSLFSFCGLVWNTFSGELAEGECAVLLVFE